MTALVAHAVLSGDGLYRYLLTRPGDILAARPPLTVCMLNPSTADHREDDATIRRLLGFMRRYGRAGLRVVNLYAYRTVSPGMLRRFGWPVGPGNDIAIRETLTATPELVCAWGTHAQPERAAHVLRLARAAGCRTLCWGRNRDGSPRHPLYLPGDAELEEYDGDVEGR